jgi:hypothetical protein
MEIHTTDTSTYWSHFFVIKKLQTCHQQMGEDVLACHQDIIYNNTNYSIRNLSKKTSTCRTKNMDVNKLINTVFLEKYCYYFFDKRQSSFFNMVTSMSVDFFYKSKKNGDDSMINYSNSLFSLPTEIFESTKHNNIDIWFIVIDNTIDNFLNSNQYFSKMNCVRLPSQNAFNIYYNFFNQE